MGARLPENSRDLVFRNTFKDVEYALRSCAGNGTRFEFECYDLGHLYNLAHFLDRGLVQRPLFVQSVFGILGGISTHPEDVVHMRRTADRLFGRDYRWSVLGAGRKQLPIAALAAAMGGNVRVGLEDSLWIGPGELATSNAVQVPPGRLSKVWAWKSRHPPMHVRPCRSRAAIRSPSRIETASGRLSTLRSARNTFSCFMAGKIGRSKELALSPLRP